MTIAEIFRSDITREIPEVIKVDFADEEVVANEIDEYVVTDHIAESFEKMLDHYQETILNPDEQINIWVSGFFGSGKSSFAKILGYLLSNPSVLGRSATERFLARLNAARIQALLNTIHDQAPTHAVFVDMSTGKNVAKEGESIVLPLYRALLESLGYSRNILLAELEFDLETDGDLDAFVESFLKIPDSKGAWEQRRNIGLARSEASYAMHLLRPKTYPQADSWTRSASEPEINANWFAKRAMEMLRRRGGAAKRALFVIDEVGQYVARSVQRMLELQGLAQATQKERGAIWLVVTSQERLEDVVDSLEGKQVELARVQARFPLRVDLLPADIDEVAGKRVLDKNAEGGKGVRAALAPNKHKLAANVRLNSPTRAIDLAEDEFVRLYPMLPYQIQLLIDAVSQRRAHGGGSPMLGGSNRTIIKMAQQLLVHPKVGLGDANIGALVTVDRAYDLLESIIPTSWQAEVGRVAERCGADSLELAVAKVIALTMDVPALPLDATNVAVMLHPSVDAESRRDEVLKVLERLVSEEVVRQVEQGYRLQSPQEKDWERTRKGIDARPADIVRLRRELLRDALRGLSVTQGRKFNVQVSVDGEKVLDGDIPLVIEEGDDKRVADLRAKSREPDAASTIWWAFNQSDEAYDTLVELHRSKEMIVRKDTPSRSSEEVELLGEERNRLIRYETLATKQLSHSLMGGQLIFRGNLGDPKNGELRSAATEAVRTRVRAIYTRLDQFSAAITKKDVVAILKADDLSGLSENLGDDGIGLTRVTPGGVEFATDRDPLAAFVDEIRQRVSYGNEVTGSHLEKRFSAPPYGAPVEVVQGLAAAGIRAGLIEVVSQGARITKADDARLERILTNLPAFRSASFRLQTGGVPLEARTQVAERLGDLTGALPSPALDALAPLLRKTFGPDSAACDRVDRALRALGIAAPQAVQQISDIVARLKDGSDEETVRTAAETWADLIAGRKVVHKLDEVVQRDEDLGALRTALAEVRQGAAGLDESAREDASRLTDLLAAGDLADHLGEIRSLATRLSQERREARGRLLEKLKSSIDQEREHLREAFGTIEALLFEEAVRPLMDLLPDDAVIEQVSVETLAARTDSVAIRATRSRTALEELSAVGEIGRVRVAALIGETPITGTEELEVALKRIREAVEEELGAGKKQVYLQ